MKQYGFAAGGFARGGAFLSPPAAARIAGKIKRTAIDALDHWYYFAFTPGDRHCLDFAGGVGRVSIQGAVCTYQGG